MAGVAGCNCSWCRAQRAQEQVKKSKIVAFGYKHGQPPSDHLHNKVIDVRRIFTRNPYHNPKLRDKTGLDYQVQNYLKKEPQFDEKYVALREQVKKHEGKMVWLGCTGGKHRSVFLAYHIGLALGRQVEYRDLYR